MCFSMFQTAILLPVSPTQVNFLTCQLFALAAAFWFRLYLSPSHANPLVRHAVASLLGIAFLIFCFGWYCIQIPEETRSHSVSNAALITSSIAAEYFFLWQMDRADVQCAGL